MSKPESLFCNMLEAQYNALISAIELLLGAPAFALARLKSNIQRLFDVLYAAIIAAIEILAAQLDELLALGAIDQNESKMAFCRIAYACQPLRSVLFSSGNPLLFFLSDQEIQDAQNNYQVFEDLICKVGLGSLLDSWTNVALDAIEAQLDALEAQLLGALGIDDLIDAYMQLLEDSGIFDFLEQLDEYAECAFEVCNWLETSDNKKEEIYEKLGVKKSGSSFIFDVVDDIQKVYDADNDISVSIAKMRARIDLYKRDGLRDTRSGKGLDEIMFN